MRKLNARKIFLNLVLCATMNENKKEKNENGNSNI